MSDDKLPPGTVIRSEDYVKWGFPLQQVLPSNPAWATLKRALPKHPLLVIRAARMLYKQRNPGAASKEGNDVLCALAPALTAATRAAPVRPRVGGPEDAIWLRVAVAHIREHGVQW